MSIYKVISGHFSESKGESFLLFAKFAGNRVWIYPIALLKRVAQLVVLTGEFQLELIHVEVNIFGATFFRHADG